MLSGESFILTLKIHAMIHLYLPRSIDDLRYKAQVSH